MLCFRDMTFCEAECDTVDCHRRFTPDQEAAAERWWGKPGAPVALSDFSTSCPFFTASVGAASAPQGHTGPANSASGGTNTMRKDPKHAPGTPTHTNGNRS